MRTVRPMLLKHVPHLTAQKKNLWDKAFAELQEVVDLYNATGLPALSGDELCDLLNDTNGLLYDKITGGGLMHLANGDGGAIPVDQEQALNVVQKPVGYDELLEGIESYVEDGYKMYADSYGREGFAVADIGKYFVLDAAGNLQYTAQQAGAIEEAGNQYIKTQKGQDTYRFTLDIARSFFEHNMDRHLHYRGKISAENLFEFLSEVMDGINLETKELLPIHRGTGSGYYADRAI